MHRLNVTLIDLVYILSGLTGLVISLCALPHYHHSARAAGRLEDDADRRDAGHISRGVLTREYVRLTIHILGTAVGIAALWVVPIHRVPPSSFDRDFGVALDAILLWANIGTTLNTATAWMEYCTLRRRGWLEKEGMLRELRARNAHAERGGKRAISRHSLATTIRAIRSLREKQRSIELHAASSDATVSDHEDRIETVEEVVRAKRRTTREIDGKDEK